MPCSIAFMVASATTVRRRSTTGAGKPERRDGVDDALGRQALVAEVARHLEGGQRRRPLRCALGGGHRRPRDRHERDVVLLLPRRAR